MLIRNIRDIEKIWTKEHGKGTLYQVFFGIPSTHEVVGIPSKRFAIAKRITSFWIMTIAPGATNPRHTHEDIEQIYFILEGEGTVSVENEEAKLRKGDAVFLPERKSHRFHNYTDKPCIILAVGAKIAPGTEYRLPHYEEIPS